MDLGLDLGLDEHVQSLPPRLWSPSEGFLRRNVWPLLSLPLPALYFAVSQAVPSVKEISVTPL